MYYKLAIITLCIATLSSGARIGSSASISRASIKGIIDPVSRCGGVGTPLQLRVSGCEGRCRLVPGTLYEMEGDFIPSSASPSLTLTIHLIHLGVEWPILSAILQDSSVQPGLIYTCRFGVVPNDLLSGNAVYLRASITHTDSGLEEICIGAEVDIA